MSYKFETPWDFINKQLSPDGKVSILYSNVWEVGMGAPLCGECCLVIDGNHYQLKGNFGGPIVWDEYSKKAAIPYWTINRSQRLAIIDIYLRKLYISKEYFSVLQLQAFKNNLVTGIDSPIYRSRNLLFNVTIEPFYKELHIV